jgi:hypothetical protein
MDSDYRLAGTARTIFSAAVLAAALWLGGCADYDVGPDPSPWSPPAEVRAQTPGK